MFEKTKNLIPLIVYLFSIFITKQLNFLFYNSTDSPDFIDYFKYFEYNVEIITNSTREQGLFYYYLQSWYFYFNNDFINSENFFVYLSKSIQEVNLLLYLVGNIGIYYILKFQKVDSKTIFLCLSALSFFPVSIAMRIVLKPEILGFALLPWIILGLEIFLKTKKIRYLYMTMPFLVIAFTTKGSILVSFGIYLLLFYFKIFKYLNIKKFLTASLIFLVILSFTFYEDQNRNDRNLFDIESGSASRDNYDNTASIFNIYNLNLFKLTTSPIRDNHANSMLGITLLDTFGDYFNLYWNNDSSNYSKYRKNIFLFEQSSNIKPPYLNFEQNTLTFFTQKNTDLYPRKSIGLLISLLFFWKIIHSLINKVDTRFIASPLIGLGVIAFHAVSGFPVTNYDPLVGDTFKTLYYSFFLCFSFIFIFKTFLNRGRYKYVKFLFFIILMLFIIGFPKNNNFEYENSISIINNYSESCELNLNYFESRFEEKQYLNCRDDLKTVPSSFDMYDDFLKFKKFPKYGLVNLINLFLSLFSITYFIFFIRSFDSKE